MRILVVITLLLAALFVAATGPMAQSAFINEGQTQSVTDELIAMHGPSERDRIERCVGRVVRMWREEDGSPERFRQFCLDNYIADPEMRQQTADRYEAAFESIYGHFSEMGRELSWHLDIETGPLLPIDYMFAAYSPSAHLREDLFTSKIAFVALLNYPRYSLPELLEQGPSLTREQWAQARLVQPFAARVPSEVSQRASNAYTAGDAYISAYNIYMYHLLTDDGRRLFPKGLRLVSHWNLRDELKAAYAEDDGLERQEMIYQVMLKIIRQEIPQAVINNPAVDWQVSSNRVTAAGEIDGDIPAVWSYDGSAGEAVDNAREPDTRYEHLLAMFRVQREIDEYYPDMPTLMDRRFERDREMPEKEVEAILVSVLSSDAVARTGKLVEKRIGRKLRPFDIWYNGFKQRSGIPEDELDEIVRAKYPTAETFRDDMPNLLGKLGFDDETAAYLTSKIEVDPSRGIGHASGPGRRADHAHLRTRVTEGGMDYKGYNIAVHEFGHNVEQVLSLNKVDHTSLRGVPNTAFTEGFAFVFQSRDLELLGVDEPDAETDSYKTLDVLWSTYEIGGVALLDMRVWNWMYDHPEATPVQLREAVVGLARELWNEYYAPVFGVEDVEILAVYSHMIDAALYLPDYPLGHIIAFQVERHLKERGLASEMERMCKLGSITPDSWMKQAVGGPISAEPLLRAADEAVTALQKGEAPRRRW